MNVGNFFKKTLPHMALAVASGIPGPVGAVAQIVNSVIPQKEGGSPVAADPKSIETAINGATPDQLVQLQQGDQAFAAKMKELGVQEEADWLSFVQQDRADARDMAEKTGSRTPAMLAWAAVITLLGCIYLLGFRTLPQTGHDALMLLLGAVTATYKDVYGYFFGSSAGSAEKTAALANIASKQ